MREAFQIESAETGTDVLLLTMAVPNNQQTISQGYDIPTLNQYLDWFNVITYNYQTTEEMQVNPAAPLYAFGQATGKELELNIVSE